MRIALVYSPVLILLASVVVVALIVGLTRIALRMFFSDFQEPSVRVPYRFSLLAIGVLTAIVACVLGLFRDSPGLAIPTACAVASLWFPIARFLQFRQVLADRRNQQFRAALDEHEPRAERDPVNGG